MSYYYIVTAYFKDVCIPVLDVSGRSNLRSVGRDNMFGPRKKTLLCRRSFRVAAPLVWISLPRDLRSTTIGREQFRARLKTHFLARLTQRIFNKLF